MKHKTRNQGRAGPAPDLRRFQPVSPTVRRTIDELLARGARLVLVAAHQVTLHRAGQQAVIDAQGRVQWAPATH